MRQPRRGREPLPGREERRAGRRAASASSTRSTWRSSRRAARDLAVTIPSVRAEVGHDVRRPAPAGRDRSLAARRAEARDARRAHRRARRRQTAQVLELIKRLRERGLGVVVISHNLADVFEVADRIFVLRLGQNGGRLQGERDQSGRGGRGDHRGVRERRGAEMSTADADGRRGRRGRQPSAERFLRQLHTGRPRRAAGRPRAGADLARLLRPGTALHELGQPVEPGAPDDRGRAWSRSGSCTCCCSARSTCRSAP